MQDVIELVRSCLFGKHIIPLIVASFFCTFTVVFLSFLFANFSNARILGGTRWPIAFLQLSKIIHISPVFAIPLVMPLSILDSDLWGHFSGFLYYRLGLSPEQCNWLLMALLGYSLHVFIGVVIFERAFGFKERYETVAKISQNLRGQPRAKLAATLLIRFLFPVAALFVIQFLMLQSMRAIPNILNVNTVMRIIANATDNVSGPAFLSIATAIILLFTILASILGVLYLAIVRARRSIARSVMASSKGGRRDDWVWNALFRLFRPTAILWICISDTLIVAMMATYLGNLLYRTGNQAPSDEMMDATLMLQTLSSPSVILGASFILLFCAYLYLVSVRILRRPPKIAFVLALTPTPVFGILILLAPQDSFIYPLCYVLIVAYALCVFVFFFAGDELKKHILTNMNSRSSNQGWTPRTVSFLTSSIGTIPIPFLFALYFLWLEDGLQQMILQSNRSLATHCFGARNGYETSFFLGAILCMVAWAALWGMAYWATRIRIGLGKHILKRVKAPGGRVITLAVLSLLYVSTTAMATEEIISQSENGEIAVIGDLSIEPIVGERVRIEKLIYGPNHRHSHIFVAKECKVLEIGEIVFEGNSASISLRAKDDPFLLDKLSVEGVETPAGPNDRRFPEIKMENIFVREALIRGSPTQEVPMLGFAMNEGASARLLSLSGFEMPEASLRLGGTKRAGEAGEPPGVSLTNILFDSIKILGPPVQSDFDESIWIEIKGRLRVLDYSRPVATILVRGLRLVPDGSEIDVKGKTDERFNEVRVQFERVVLEEGKGGAMGRGSNDEGAIHIRCHDVISQLKLSDVTLVGDIKYESNTNTELEVVDTEGWSSAYTGSIEIASPSISSFKAVNLNVHNLHFAADVIGNETLRLSNLSIQHTISVPSEFMKGIVTSMDLSRTDKSSALHLLEKKGIYSEDENPIGLDALYERKKSDLAGVHRGLAFVVDWLTGFGVKVYKPFLLFLGLSLLHLTLRFAKLFQGNKEKVHNFQKLISLSAAGVIGALVGIEESSNDLALQRMRKAFSTLFNFQVALLFLYLGGTVMQ